MQHYIFILLLFTLTTVQPVRAQSADSLAELKGHSFRVFYSYDQQERAETIAVRIDKATAFHQQLLGFKPTVTVFILSAKDWQAYTSEPVVYGMPHYNDKHKKLIVAAEDNPFWKSFLPPVDQLPQELREPVRSTYTGTDGHLTAQAFFDLLAIHELGHAFHIQGGLTMQRKWMGELYCNILLHTYIVEKEPGLLPALTLFPRMVVAGGTKGFKYTSLADAHEHYNELGQQYPRNYGWYQCRWHSAAAGIYDTAGKNVCKKLWDAFITQKEILADAALLSFISAADKTVADMINNWDRDTIK